jgi:molybdopterin-guanine dinucleotide biosynthesis protein A
LFRVRPTQERSRSAPFTARSLPALEKLFTETDSASVRDFLDLISPKYIQAAKLSADENLLLNVNFPADYQKIA